MKKKESVMKKVAVSHRLSVLVGVMLVGSSTLLMAQAGSLDPTFGTGGIVTTPNTGAPVAIAIQSDGRILVAGESTSGEFPTLGLARYNTDGSLDSTFGTGGIVTDNSVSPAFAMTLQSDGKILAGAIKGASLAVLRFNTNGSLDSTFGSGGIASFGQFGVFFSPITGGIAVETNATIVVAATTHGFGVGVILRLLTNGQLDTSFGTNGAVAPVAIVNTLALAAGGNILIASTSLMANGGAARYDSNGSLDTTFGAAGQVPSLGPASAIAALSNGKLLLAGTLVNAQPSVEGIPPQAFALVRYNSTGTIDATFGIHGAAITPFTGNGFSEALALAVESNGDIVAGGQTGAEPPNFSDPSDFALARYTSNGQLDATFGTDGLVTTSFDNDVAFITALAIQSDGKIVAVGSNNPTQGSNPGFTLARYLSQ